MTEAPPCSHRDRARSVSVLCERRLASSQAEHLGHTGQRLNPASTLPTLQTCSLHPQQPRPCSAWRAHRWRLGRLGEVDGAGGSCRSQGPPGGAQSSLAGHRPGLLVLQLLLELLLLQGRRLLQVLLLLDGSRLLVLRRELVLQLLVGGGVLLVGVLRLVGVLVGVPQGS